MLLNMEEMLRTADANDFAVGAFNATESSLFRSVAEEAERQDAPAIVQAAPGEFQFATREFYTYVRERLANSPAPFVLHLDHGKSMEECLRAIQAGFTSVMFDGSALSYEENVRQTAEVVRLAHMVGVSVEGEIGTIGVMSNSDEDGRRLPGDSHRYGSRDLSEGVCAEAAAGAFRGDQEGFAGSAGSAWRQQ